MEEFLENLFKIYEERREEFKEKIRADKVSFRETFLWSPAVRIEDTFQAERAFFVSMVDDVRGLMSIKQEKFELNEWHTAKCILENHNERLACSIKNLTLMTGAIAIVIAVLLTFMNNGVSYFWGAVLGSIWSVGQLYKIVVLGSHSLSRNKELIRIIENALIKEIRLENR